MLVCSDQGVCVAAVGMANFRAPHTETVARQTMALLDAGNAVILDMEGVEFIDSSGLGVLARLASSHSRSLALAGVGPRLSALLARVPASVLPRQFACISDATAAFVAAERVSRTA